MRAFSEPLSRLLEDAAWFARAREVTLLVVRTSTDLRRDVLALLASLEFHADNRSPWVLFEDPYAEAGDGWYARSNRLAEHWQRRRAALAEEGIEAGVERTVLHRTPTPATEDRAAPSRRSSDRAASPLPSPGMAAFQQTVAEVLRALDEPLRGLVLVLAPTVVDDAAALVRELAPLFTAKRFDGCRLVLVLDADEPVPAPLRELLGERMIECECAADEKDLERDVEALIASGEGTVAALAGTAGPRDVVPPRRVDDPPELAKEERDRALGEAGIDPRFVEEAPALRKLVLGAALAMKQGRGAEAIELQRRARDLCARLAMHEVEVVCQIALASYLSGLGMRDLAVRELEDASRNACSHALLREASQASLALGLVHALAKRFAEAARAYTDAARWAEEAGVPQLAIEAWRLAGQLALEAELEKQAVACFENALRIAGGAEPQLAKASATAEVARQLAAVYRNQGQRGRAESLFEQADRIERGEASTPVQRSELAPAATTQRCTPTHPAPAYISEVAPPPESPHLSGARVLVETDS